MNLRLSLSFLIFYFFTFSTYPCHAFKLSLFSDWRQVAMLFKTMSSMTMRFFKINGRRAFTKSRGVFCNCYHTQVSRIPAINSFTNVVYIFSTLKLFMQNHGKLMCAYLLAIVTNITIARANLSPLPKPTRIRNLRLFFKLIKIKNIISWRFKNAFHLSPNTGLLEVCQYALLGVE